MILQNALLHPRRLGGRQCRIPSRPARPFRAHLTRISADEDEMILSELDDDDLVALLFDDIFDGVKELF